MTAAMPSDSAHVFQSCHGVRRLDWWTRYYPERCAKGHKWGPGRITVSWVPCDCPPAAAAREHGPGHLTVYCETRGCRSTWYKPRHERRG